MVEGLDSENPPSATQARAAAAGGKSIWSGYLATKPDVGLARPWTQAEFENARLAGNMPLAYCSGWDDPVALKALAAAWNVRLCLDDEGGIRPTGSWEQPFLDAIRDDARGSGGLYGNGPVHRLGAIFHVLAAYPSSGDPTGASWNATARPSTPCGWQWAGTHPFAAPGLPVINVDSTWFDDWFGGLHGDGGGSLTRNTPRRATASVASQNAINLFGRGTDNALWTLRYDGASGVWSDWKTLGGILSSPDIVAIQRGDQIDVFVLGQGPARSDGTFRAAVFHIYSFDDGATWSQFEPHGGDLTGSLAGIGSIPAAPIDFSKVLAAIKGIPSPAAVDLSQITVAVNAALAAAQDAKAAAQTAHVAAQSAAESAARIEAAVNDIRSHVDTDLK